MPVDNCATRTTVTLPTLDQAREIIEARVRPLQGYAHLMIRNCAGRVLFEDLHAPADIPADTQSAMDGYAFRASELDGSAGGRFRLAGSSRAGWPYRDTLKPFECVRVFTGASLPPGADSVVMQEDVRHQSGFIEIPAGTAVNENLRRTGDEIRKGQRVLAKGKRISPIDMGILAALGITEIRVRRLPRVAFISAGDELMSLDQPIRAGRIYDSNRYLLSGMLQTLGITPLDLGVVPDDRDAIVEALHEAQLNADVLITTGGSSVGEKDLVKDALESSGRIDFWRIAVKPGKPLVFGRVGEAHFFALSGNPVSVAVIFYELVRPALLRLMGVDAAPAFRLTARCLSGIRRSPGRQEYQRGSLRFDASGSAEVTPAEKQQSHNLLAMAGANCFIVLPADCSGVEAGETVEVEIIDPAFHFN